MQVSLFESVPLPESNEALYARIYNELSNGRRHVNVTCLIRRYVNTMGKVHLLGDKLEVRLNEIIAAAPLTVRESLARILVSKLFRRRVPEAYLLHYRRFMNSRDVRHAHQTVRQVRGRKYVSGPKGEHYDLDPLFDRLRDLYFSPLMPKPQLGWSRGRARWLLGHFDAAHNAIILSRILDSPRVPEIAVEYVLYHEMLHLKHPVEHKGARRRVHTRAFLADEKLFAGLKEAKAALKLL